MKNMVKWASWGTLVLLCISSYVYAQPGAGEGEPTAEAAEGSQEAAEGILPVPDYSGDWMTRPFLTGDWGGTRQDLANKGFTFSMDWLQVGQGVVSGGVDEDWAYVTNLDYYLKADLMRMGVLPGAVITVRGQSRFGSTVNEDTGLLLPVNTYSLFPLEDPVDDNVPIALTELNYLQFFSEDLALVLGKITTLGNSNEFGGGEGKSQFMNFQFQFSSVYAQVAPYSTLAVGGVWLPCPEVSVTSMLMNTTDASTSSGFGDIGDGTTWATFVDAQYGLGGQPGGMTLLGVYAFDGEFAQIGGLNISPEGEYDLRTESSSWAVSLSGWQYLFTEEDPPEAVDASNGCQDLEGLGLFATAGWAERTTNPVTWSIATGLSGRGSIPGRDDDTWGIGYFFNDLQDSDSILLDSLAGSTQGFEVYYKFAVTKSVALTLDYQWTKSAFRDIDDASTLGVRLLISF